MQAAAQSDWEQATRHSPAPNRCDPLIRNRRYKKLQLLIAEGAYFSAQSIQERDPALYHQYLGRCTPAGIQKMPEGLKLSEQLLHKFDRDTAKAIMAAHAEDDQIVEE